LAGTVFRGPGTESFSQNRKKNKSPAGNPKIPHSLRADFVSGFRMDWGNLSSWKTNTGTRLPEFLSSGDGRRRKQKFSTAASVPLGFGRISFFFVFPASRGFPVKRAEFLFLVFLGFRGTFSGLFFGLVLSTTFQNQIANFCGDSFGGTVGRLRGTGTERKNLRFDIRERRKVSFTPRPPVVSDRLAVLLVCFWHGLISKSFQRSILKNAFGPKSIFFDFFPSRFKAML